MKINYYLVIILFVVQSLVTAQSVNVPLDYKGYEFMERCQTKGLVTSFELQVRPVSRKIFAELLQQIQDKTAQNPDLFSKTEWQMFDQLKGDFADELNASLTTGLSRERHLLEYIEDNSQIYVDAMFKVNTISNRGPQYDPNQLINETTMGGIIRGALGEKLGFYLDARNSLIRGRDIERESFNVSQGSPVVTTGNNVYQDRAVAYFVVEKPWLRLLVGRDEFQWGPGFHGGLSISRNMPPADMFRIQSAFKRFQFSSSHMILSSALGSKFLAAHRFDFLIMPGLYIAGTETVLYGNRDMQFAYLNPLMPYHIAEHHLGDKDNNTMSADIVCTLIPRVKLYGEFFIDDMTSSESLTKYFGNKFAVLTGFFWADPLGVKDLDIKGEYARVEPYVYSHKDSITIYTNYDKVIGHWLGPNSDSVILLAGYQFNRDVRCEMSFERIRFGDGNASTIDGPETGVGKEFLGRVYEKQMLYGFKMIDQIRRDFYVSFSYTYAKNTNINQVQGVNSNDHLARFELYLNY